MEKGKFKRPGWKTRQSLAAAFGLATLLIIQAPARAKDGASWLGSATGGIRCGVSSCESGFGDTWRWGAFKGELEGGRLGPAVVGSGS
jgi:hypothetical protein